MTISVDSGGIFCLSDTGTDGAIASTGGQVARVIN